MIKKLLVLFSFFYVSIYTVLAQDTVHIRSHNETHMNWYGDFYTKTKFPPVDSSFKKIILKYTIGCPSNGCSDWDYTTKVFARRPIGIDTAGNTLYEYIEFARYITPYSGDKVAGFYREYSTEITDFRSVLTDSVEIGVKYEGYSDGFTVSLDYYFIKGTPIREAYKVVPIYYGGFPYGDPNNSIENYIKPFSFTPDSTTTEVGIHILQTGHGFGGNEDCAEFCPKYNFIKVNGTQRYSNLVWKDDCGKNPLFPQPGTWLYDRANWCPGEMVRPFYHDITPYLNIDTTNIVDMDMTPFTNVGNNSCSYNIAANLIYYKNRVDSLDLSLEDIISPSTDWNYSRINPVCSSPKIKVKNNGNKTVEGINIQYQVLPNGAILNYLWNNTLGAYESREIDLPSIALTGEQFKVSISYADSNLTELINYNNTKISTILKPKAFPQKFGIEFRSNSAPAENSYELLDAAGNVILARDNFSAVKMHKDTVNLPNGCYTFIFHDTDKDGLVFFANTDGSGSLRIRNMADIIIHTFNPNFGAEIRYQFVVDSTLNTFVSNEEYNPIEIYPNPAHDKCYIENVGTDEIKKVNLYNLQGQLLQIYDDLTVSDRMEINTATLSPAYYFFEIETTKSVYRKKLLIKRSN